MLNQQIREVIQNFRTVLPAELNALIEQGAGEISALDIVERAVKAGDSAPAFALNNQHGEARSLQAYLQQGPLVLTFYRGVWCPYCNLQLRAYGQRLDEITATGAQLVAITPEKPDAVDVLKAGNTPDDIVNMAVDEVPFDVLYDQGAAVAEQFGLQFELPDSHKQILKAFNIDVEQLTGDTRYTFPDPATYVIDTNGTIRWAFVPNNYRKRAEVDDIVAALQALA